MGIKTDHDQDRRQWLHRLAILLSAQAITASPFAIAGNNIAKLALSAEQQIVGCAHNNKAHFLVSVSPEGKLNYQIPLPARGHGIAASANHKFIACVARRPGDFCLLLQQSADKPNDLHWLKPPQGLYFYGHAQFSGNHLLLTAGDSDNSQGHLLIYDITRHQWLADYTDFGIGPHEFLINQQQEIIIAVGGIHTQNRKKLNIAEMTPALVKLDYLTGKINNQWFLSDNHLSIRHLAHNNTGTTYIACQGQSPHQERCLLWHQSAEQPLQPIQPNADYWSLFEDYLGSVITTRDHIIASTPRGHLIGIWDQKNLELVQLLRYEDICGLTALNDQNQTTWLASTGNGQLIRSTGTDSTTPWHWDNHLLAI